MDTTEPNVDDRYVSVPRALVEAVAHIGVDFGYGKYELEQKWIELARRKLEAKE